MNSKEIFEKISKRNKYVIECGARRNNTYLKYLNASTQYDLLKKAFYTSVNLARLDEDVSEEQLQRYEHVVKHYDKQLLSQLKDRNYNVNKISLVENEPDGNDGSNDDVPLDENIERDKEKDSFAHRISKIENAGYSRNRYHFEFTDNKEDFDKAKQLFLNETLLAFQDGLISDIEHQMHYQSIKKMENELDDELFGYQRNFNTKRQEESNHRNHDHVRQRGSRGHVHSGSRGNAHSGSRGNAHSGSRGNAHSGSRGRLHIGSRGREHRVSGGRIRGVSDRRDFSGRYRNQVRGGFFGNGGPSRNGSIYRR